MRSLKPHKGRGGFSLLELLVAATVMTLAILGSLSAHAGSQKLARAAQETERAVSDLEAAMERVLLSTWEEVTLDFPDGAAIAAFDELHLIGEQIAVTYPNMVGGQPAPDPLEIRVTINWQAKSGQPRTLSLSTLMTR